MTRRLEVLDELPATLANKNPPDLLYHYTSQKGLLGIIEKKKLWATNIRYLNDSQELKQAIALAKVQLRKQSGDRSIREFVEKACRTLDDSLSVDTPFAIYVASFSTCNDMLSQWRGYCPSGSGFSVGFKVNNLRKLAGRRSQEIDIAFIPCIYDKDEQDRLISELIYAARNAYADQSSPEVLFLFLMLRWAAAIKHRGFDEEREWRLVAGGTRADSLVREGRSFLVPYIEFDLVEEGKEGIDCIESVTVGPTSHPKLSEQSVKDLLDRHGVGNCATTRSEIPFRNW
jgi:hypothetical protein